MENENKNAPKNQQGDKRKHHHRPKGYFIEPKKVADGTSEPIKESERSPQKPQDGSKVQNHKKHHKNVKNNENVSNEAKEPQAVQSQKQSAEGENHHKRNRNRHRNKQRRKQDNVVAEERQTTEATNIQGKSAKESEKKSKKSYERPTSKKVSAEPIQIDPDEYEAVSFPAISEERSLNGSSDSEPSPMVEVVGIRFKSTGKTYYFAPNGNTLKKGEHAIVETARGLEYGDVAMGNSMVRESDTVSPLRPVIRVATPADTKRHEENKKKEDEAFGVCNEKILEHKLDMKLIDAQYTFDNSKLLFYFTSSGRVDFRELVKDLAGVFRTRIELRQIGIRDEAKIMGGVGMCGRPLCCTLFLSDFGQVSIKMAKEQNLSLNCAKISGICGRLMCCLRYEHEVYEYEIKRTPPVDSLVQTADGTGTVTEIHPLRGTVKVRLANAPDNQPKLYKREDVVMLQKKAPKANKQEQ